MVGRLFAGTGLQTINNLTQNLVFQVIVGILTIAFGAENTFVS
jgi:hypothetical protein